jgi:cytidine deaminase
MNQIDITAKITVYGIAEATGERKRLIEAAKQATHTSYSPYSGYSVGAALLLDNGEIITASNQENAAYPSGLCAERTALFYANARYPESAVKMAAIAAFTNGEYAKEICSPCGACRQVFVEVENRYNSPVTILMCSREEVYEVDSIRALMPLCFTKDSMG